MYRIEARAPKYTSKTVGSRIFQGGKMKNYKVTSIVLMVFWISACRTTTPTSIFLHANTLTPQSGAVGIMVTSAKVDTSFPGAGCLLCIAMANGANSALTKHAHTMSNQDVLK